jgi:hypothetical protein
MFGRVTPSNIAVSLDIEEIDGKSIGIDDATLERVLLNLLVNARDACEPGDTITVRLFRKHVTNGYAASFNYHSGVKPGHYTLIQVQDTGTGMPDHVLQKATQPYFSTKGPGQGSGLGLASVNGLCRQLGGGLLISSEAGSGTEITIALPVEPETPRETTAERAQSAPVQPMAVDMIIAAANEKDKALLRSAALERGHSVRLVTSVSQLFDTLEHEPLPNVILLGDNGLDGLSSSALTTQVRERFPSLPIAMISDGLSPKLVSPMAGMNGESKLGYLFPKRPH